MYGGRVFEYSKGLSAFQSGDLDSLSTVILIGGLYDGLNTLSYAKGLSHFLEKERISLIQPILPSSYHGFGHSSIEEDAIHINSLVMFCTQMLGIKVIVLLGHSTGCQDIMEYAGKFKVPEGVRLGAILQGPVSDREYWASHNPPLMARLLEWAHGKGDELYPELVEGVPMTARRIRALMERGGEDDFFSTDLTDAERLSKLQTISFPTLAVFSGADEYFPFGRGQLDGLEAAFRRCWGVETMVIEGADHALTSTSVVMFEALKSFHSKLL